MPFPTDFRWATGIECSFIPHLGIDQYRWTQHDKRWREDFALIAQDLECRWLRYALPWHEIEPEPGVFQWEWFDERLAAAESLGIEFLLDLVHFGVPAWLPEAFADADLPGALESFARAFGQRYAGRVSCVCPINEPLITALFCGDVGLWPPYGRGLRSYTTVLCRVAQALSRAVKTLRETMPGVEILVSDSLEVAVTHEDADEKTSPYLKESLRADVARRMHRRHIVLDLLMGRVDGRHPLLGWLRESGMSDYDLRWFVRNPQAIDILGLDYYEHTEVELYTTPEGYYRQRELRPPVGLYRAAQDYWNRYRIPLMITETSVGGADDTKIAWLERSVHDVRRLREEGFPVIGYTWWPAIDHLDWDGALLHQTGHIHPVGIYRLTRERSGQLTRSPTELRDVYRRLVQHGNDSAGPLKKTDDSNDKRATAKAAIHRERALSPIIAFSRSAWNGLRGRPQQLLARLSKQRRTLYVESPVWSETEDQPRSGLQFHPEHPHLSSLALHLPLAMRGDDAFVAQTCRRLVLDALAAAPLDGHFSNPVLWIDDFAAGRGFIGEIGEKCVVVDCFGRLPAIDLVDRAHLVLADGRELESRLRKTNARVLYAPPGVDVPHFCRARRNRLAIPHDVHFVPGEILGYMGAIDDGLDYDLIDALAETDESWSIVMVGPVSNPQRVPRRKNIFWIGKRHYADIANYARAFRLGLAPFVVNEETQLVTPGKINEYLVAGLPVVSTALPEVEERYGGAVRVGRDFAAFIAHCRETLATPQETAGSRLAVSRSWHRAVCEIERALAEIA